MTLLARTFLICLAAGLGVASHAAVPVTTAMPPDLPPMDTQGRIVWGTLLKPDATSPFGYFSAWSRLREAASLTHAPSVIKLNAYLARQTGESAALPANTLQEAPKTELTVDAQGENFQGVSLSLIRLDASGRAAAPQPWSAGIAKDERFRIRVLSSFDAVVVLGTHNAKGRFNQVYPAGAGMVVVARAGEPFWLPLGEKSHLQYAGDPVLNPLTLTVRDVRSFPASHAAQGPAHVQDDRQATLLIQSVSADSYPAIAVLLPSGRSGPAKP